MKKIAWFKIRGKLHYPSQMGIMILAMFLANLHILYQMKCLPINALRPESYFALVLMNICIGFVLMCLIVQITSYLDLYYPLGRGWQQRIKWQILFGVFVPIMLIGLIVLLYFIISGIKINGSCYLDGYLHQIIGIALLLNGYLIFCRKNVSQTKIAIVKKDLRPIKELSPKLYRNIACIYIEGKYYFSLNFKGEKSIWNYSLSESMLYLPSENFYPIKRSFIVNRLAILKVVVLHAKKTKIVLKQPINLELEISQRINVAFKRWYAKKMLKQ